MDTETTPNREPTRSEPVAVLYADGTLSLGRQYVEALSAARGGVRGQWELGGERCSALDIPAGREMTSKADAKANAVKTDDGTFLASPWDALAREATAVEVVSPLAPTNTTCWFAGFTQCVSFNLELLDLSGVALAPFMFAYCLTASSIKGLLLNGSCVNMGGMFYKCLSLTRLDVSGWNTGALENANGMFSDCLSLTSLDVSGWDTEALCSAKGMFQNCHALAHLDTSDWTTEALEDAKSMFFDCTALTDLDVSGWATGALRNAQCMFGGCSSLTRLDVSGWDTGALENASYLFYECASLTHLDVSGWDTGALVRADGMFHGCPLATRLRGRFNVGYQLTDRSRGARAKRSQ